jgi:hypothetical protein
MQKSCMYLLRRVESQQMARFKRYTYRFRNDPVRTEKGKHIIVLAC